MKIVGSLLVAALLCGGGALAATKAPANPPSAAQKAEFYSECMKIAENSTLCTCKAEQAMNLVDADFMKVVLSTMNGKALPVEDSKAYGIYVSKSNAVCAPGM